MRNPLSRRPGGDPRPSLRERAAGLRAAAARLMRGTEAAPLEPPPPAIEAPGLIRELIERHGAAWCAYQTAPPGEAAQFASDEMDAALVALLGTGCANRSEAIDLLEYLRWYLAIEHPNNQPENFDWRVAQARAADLALLLGPAAERPG